jgi:putative transposase
MHAVVVEAYVKGVSTRKVDDLVRALGCDGISKSEVSRICKTLDEQVRTFLGRGIDQECPYLWLEATFHKVREAGRVLSVATVVAIGVTSTGERTVLGAQRARARTTKFWVAFLRSLVKRGLRRAVGDLRRSRGLASGHRQGPVRSQLAALSRSLHVNLLSVVPKQAQDAVAALVRMIFAEPDHVSAMTKLHEVARMLEERFPQAAELLDDAAEDVLARLHFPQGAPPTPALHEPSRALAQGDQAPNPRRRDLPQP